MTEQAVHPVILIFRKRARAIYGSMKKRAAKEHRVLGFPYGIFEIWLMKQFGTLTGASFCAYSGNLIVAENFVVDHARPISRGGSFDLSNLVLCTEKENLRKANMTAEEYRKFRQFVLSFPSEVTESIFRRLEVGDVQRYSFFRKRSRRRKTNAAV